MSGARRAMLAKLHLARRDLALTEDSYRDVLRRVTGQESAAALDERQLDRVLRDFARLGWKPKPARTGTSKHAQIRMIHAVWGDICRIGGLTRASGEDAGHDAEDEREALRAFVRRQAGVDAPEFLDSTAANKVLEGLKAWRARLRRRGAG